MNNLGIVVADLIGQLANVSQVMSMNHCLAFINKLCLHTWPQHHRILLLSQSELNELKEINIGLAPENRCTTLDAVPLKRLSSRQEGPLTKIIHVLREEGREVNPHEYDNIAHTVILFLQGVPQCYQILVMRRLPLNELTDNVLHEYVGDNRCSAWKASCKILALLIKFNLPAFELFTRLLGRHLNRFMTRMNSHHAHVYSAKHLIATVILNVETFHREFESVTLEPTPLQCICEFANNIKTTCLTDLIRNYEKCHPDILSIFVIANKKHTLGNILESVGNADGKLGEFMTMLETWQREVKGINEDLIVLQPHISFKDLQETIQSVIFINSRKHQPAEMV